MDKRTASRPDLLPTHDDALEEQIQPQDKEQTHVERPPMGRALPPTQAKPEPPEPPPPNPYPTRPLPGDEKPVPGPLYPEDNALGGPQTSEIKPTRAEQTRARVVDILADPRYWGKTQEELGKLIGISGRQIRHYKTPALLREVRARYHENHVPTALLDVDKAMLSKASGKHADVPAAKLVYQRFDGMGDKDAFDQAPLEINIIARGDAGTAAAGVRIRARRGIK